MEGGVDYASPMKSCLIFVAITLLLAACSVQPALGVACAEQEGSLHVVHLGPEEIEHGFPYTINVYLPPCYQVENERRYPILYLFPGRSSLPSTWFDHGVGEAADKLVTSGEIPPLIMVGLENIEWDYEAETFANYIYPYVESHYRNLPGRQYHAVAGGSMGGAPSYRMALRFPERFSSAGLFGSGIILGEEERVSAWLAALAPNQRPRLFLNTGLQDADLIDRAQELEAIFSQHGVTAHTIYTDGGHSYTYWVSNFDEFLRWLAENWES
jgi:enterochelin esterase-like enzyme